MRPLHWVGLHPVFKDLEAELGTSELGTSELGTSESGTSELGALKLGADEWFRVLLDLVASGSASVHRSVSKKEKGTMKSGRNGIGRVWASLCGDFWRKSGVSAARMTGLVWGNDAG